MTSRDLIDVQFDRAVEIVQGLPKTGPIQTDYEEKLTMYSLYKQATVGNVKTPRPGIWDMLGRAKWDAWAKHKDLDPYEAKWLYVDALLKVLRKYSDKTIAKDLVQELESYNGDPSHIVLSRTLSKSANSDSSGSTASEDDAQPRSQFLRSQQLQAQAQSRSFQQGRSAHPDEGDSDSQSEEEDDDEEHDEARELPHPQGLDPSSALMQSQLNRPQSSLSVGSNRYRTPLAGSLAMSPPPPAQIVTVPAMQPMPGFETPSAFAEPSPTSIPSSLYPGSSSIAGYPESSRGSGLTSPPTMFGPHTHGSSSSAYRNMNMSQPQSLPMGQYGVVRPASSLALERALESMQAQIAALNERIETLEVNASPSGSRARLSASRASRDPSTGRKSPPGDGDHWDAQTEDLG
ncbi:hypothetical protein V5O48_008243, partial [Marasmius crinis-equi]